MKTLFKECSGPGIVLGLMVSIGALCAMEGRCAQGITVRNIGPPDAYWAAAEGLNNRGQLVGGAVGATRCAFLWSEETGLIVLNSVPANSIRGESANEINNGGVVIGVGNSIGGSYGFRIVPQYDSMSDRFLWWSDADADGKNDLLIPFDEPVGPVFCAVKEVNEAGFVVGMLRGMESAFGPALLWDPNNQKVNLGVTLTPSDPMSINNQGTILAGAYLLDPFDSDNDGVPDTWLPDMDETPPGFPVDLTDNGLVLLRKDKTLTPAHFQLWKRGVGGVAFASADAPRFACAEKCNKDGQVVGWYNERRGTSIAEQTVAFVWSKKGGFIDLPFLPVPSGATDVGAAAVDISDDGLSICGRQAYYLHGEGWCGMAVLWQLPANTPAGPEASVSDEDTSVKIADVKKAGYTEIAAEAEVAVPLPEGWTKVKGPVDISTTAIFEGAAEVSMRVDPAKVAPENISKVHMFHLKDGVWIDVTEAFAAEAGVAKGVTDSLSPFVLAMPTDSTPPVISDLQCPTTVRVGTPFSLSLHCVDSESLLSQCAYRLSGSDAWVPMLALDGAIDEAAEDFAAEIPALPTGVYSLENKVGDVWGNASMSELPIAVDDPSAGFVTGGGWINSPAGACADYPNATGKASFGFVSKYQKGATVPTGNTEFQFKAGNLNFKSTSYDWLVVAGARAQFKGEGLVNGAPPTEAGAVYKFMLTAVDGQLNSGGGTDRFRIKIWSETAAGDETLLYDNELGPVIRPISKTTIEPRFWAAASSYTSSLTSA